MNKRIKKKRRKLMDVHIGDNVYKREDLAAINKVRIVRGLIVPMYRQIINPKIIKPRVKRLINYIYKKRNHEYLSYKHLKFARLLKPKDDFIMPDTPKIIAGGSNWEYASSTFVPIKPKDDDVHERILTNHESEEISNEFKDQKKA